VRPAIGTAALGLLLVLVAGAFDAEPLWVPGVVFVLLAVVATAWVTLSARGVTVERRLAARRVVEEEALEVHIEVRAGRLPLPTGGLVDPLLDEQVPLRAGRRRVGVKVQARFARRGRRTLPAPVAVLRDPFGLVTRRVGPVDDASAEDVLVLPRLEPVRAVARGGEGGRRRGGRPAAAAEVEFDGVREHRLGTPASRIYWPALARGAGLMERRLRAETDTRPLVVLDARGVGPAEQDDLDKAVRACASLARSLAEAGGCAVLLPGDRRATDLDPALGAWPHLHARLALVAAGERPSLSGVATRSGPVVYVAARMPARTPAALSHAPANGRTLVVPGSVPGRRPAFTVAGCTGYALEAGRGAGSGALAGAAG
jgi:uncharacterized protein (DUF58 family)